MSRPWLIAASAAAHLAVGVSVFLSGAWRIDRMDAERQHTHLGVMLPPPAASGGPVAPEKPKFTPKEIPKTISRDLHQPEKPSTKPTRLEASDQPPGTGNGSGDVTSTSTCRENCGDPAPPVAAVCGNSSREDGEQCDDGNNLNGDGCSSTCSVEPPRPPSTAIVTAKVLAALRTSGDTAPRPSSETQQQMMRDGASKVSAVVKVCVTTGGGISSAQVQRPAGYPEYDRAILSAIGTWRYEPYTIEGRPVPACSVVNFVYTMR